MTSSSSQRTGRALAGAFRILDLALGVGTLGFAVYDRSIGWGLLGIAGLVLAALNLSGNAWGFILKRLRRPSSATAPAAPSGFPPPPSTPYAPGKQNQVL